MRQLFTINAEAIYDLSIDVIITAVLALSLVCVRVTFAFNKSGMYVCRIYFLPAYYFDGMIHRWWRDCDSCEDVHVSLGEGHEG